MNIYVNSLISFIAFLSIFSSSHPSQATRSSHSNVETQEPKKGHKRTLRKGKETLQTTSQNKARFILSPFKWPEANRSEFPLSKQEMSDRNGILSPLPPELREQIFIHLNPESSLMAPLVCKNWDRLVRSGKDNLFNKLEYASPEELTLPSLLRNFLFHRETIEQLHRTLAPPFFEDIMKNEKSGDVIVLPEGMERFIEAIKSFTACHLTLARMYVNLDPLHDWQTIWLASHVIQDVPGLQDLLQSVMESNAYDLKKFKLIIRGKQNHPPLKRYLMALRLLADTGNREAYKLLLPFGKSYADWAPDEDAIFTTTRFLTYIFDNPDYYTWSLYTGNDSLIGITLSSLREIMRGNLLLFVSPNCTIDIRDIEKFGNLAFTLFPSLVRDYKDDFEKQTSKTFKEIQLKTNAQQFLDEQYTSRNQDDPDAMVELAESFAKVGEYERAIQILEEVIGEDDQSPLKFLASFYSIQHVLNEKNKIEFGNAYEAVNQLLSLPFILISGPTKGIKEMDVIVLKIILCIHLGQFEEAYTVINSNAKMIYCPDDNDHLLFKALQAQLPNLPNKLVKLLLKCEPLRAYLKDPSYTINHTDLYDKYPDVFDFFLNKEWFKKLRYTWYQSKKNLKREKPLGEKEKGKEKVKDQG